MAAKKPRNLPKYLQDDLRLRIKTGQAIDLLNRIVLGELEVSTSRMKAIEILLRKTLPDLKSVELTGGGGEPIVFTWGKPE